MRSLILILLTFGSIAFAADEPNKKHFLNTDVFQLEMAADPQISPDGSRIAYARHSNDIMTDQTRSNIWVVGTDGRGHRPLLSGTWANSHSMVS